MADPRVVLARGWKVEIEIDSSFVEVKGLKTIGLTPGVKDADITVKESGDYDESLPARRTMEIKLTGKKLEASTGEEDPGQAGVEALAEEVDVAGVTSWKVTSPGGKLREFDGWVKMDALGGDIDEGSDWGCTIRQTGAVTIT